MSKKSLETIVGKQKHVKHHDPLEPINHHVVFLLFISLLFLMGVFVFLTAAPGEGSATTYAIMDFNKITIHKDIASSVSNFISDVRHSENRPLVLLVLYTFWIILFGLINMVLFERQIRK